MIYVNLGVHPTPPNPDLHINQVYPDERCHIKGTKQRLVVSAIICQALQFQRYRLKKKTVKYPTLATKGQSST